MQLIQTKFSSGQCMVKYWKKYQNMVSSMRSCVVCTVCDAFLEPVVKPEKPSIPNCYGSLKELYSCQQVLAEWSVNDGHVDYDNFHLQLWKAMNLFPVMAEAKTRLIVPHALNFV